MADPEKQPEQPKAVQQKLVIANKVTGTVKWFNVKSGYGFINRNDTKEDVFVHQSAIVKNNPRKAVRSVGDGEVVEFDVVIGEKGHEAANVTGPSGGAVKGSPYAADKRRGYRAVHWYINQKRGNARTQRRPREGQEGYESGEAKTDDETNAGEQGSAPGQQRRYRVRRQYDGYYRGSRRTGPSALQLDSSGEVGEQEAEGTGEGGVTRGGGRGRGGPSRRYFRRNFRGGRGGGPSRRPRSQDGQVTGEEEGIVVAGAIGSIGVIETIGGSRGGARGWSRGGAARARYGRRMPQQRHPRATSCERAMDRGNRRYGSGGLTFLPVSHRPPAPITDTFAEASDSLLKSEQKSDAPKDKDAPAAAPAPQESQPVQNTTTESTA